MVETQQKKITVQTLTYLSHYAQREVILDFYFETKYELGNNSTATNSTKIPFNILLVNDGQDLESMNFADILSDTIAKTPLKPLLVVGIHCAVDRKNEYGMIGEPDYKGRGAKAGMYGKFIMQELLPFVYKSFPQFEFDDHAFAGFSLGGLAALDITLNFADTFNKVGVFSGSLWWRDKDQLDPDFDENKNRMMHQKVKNGPYLRWIKYYFEVGTDDEKQDRNHNGIIDAIDDTVALIKILVQKGYQYQTDVRYRLISGGKHDVATWAYAFPDFLEWGWKQT